METYRRFYEIVEGWVLRDPGIIALEDVGEDQGLDYHRLRTLWYRY